MALAGQEKMNEDFESQALAHLSDLYGAALRLTRNPSNAEDLVQEAVLRAWNNWDRFKQGTNCRAWLLRILTNTFINGYRRNRTEQGFMDGRRLGTVADGSYLRQGMERWSNPACGYEHNNMSTPMASALERLKPEFRTVLVLSDVRDLSYKEIAKLVGVPIGTVMSRLFRARRNMRGMLNEHARAFGFGVAQAA
jgi:RNA polymerase sigma-70 factor (ECF subfamily)